MSRSRTAITVARRKARAARSVRNPIRNEVYPAGGGDRAAALMGTCGITRSSVTTQRATGPTSLHGQLAMRKGQCRRRRHPAKIASKLPVNNDLNVQAIDPSCQSQYRHTRVKSLFSSALTRRISTRFVTVADTCQLPARSVQETETGIQRCYKTSRSCRGRTASRSLCCKQRWVLSVISTVDNTCEVAMVNKP